MLTFAKIPLEDSKTLGCYKIIDEHSTIHLKTQPKIRIFIKPLEGEK